MANRAELRKKIQARQAEKQAAVKTKYAKMRQVANDAPGGVEKELQQLADACSAQAEAFENLKENLDLIQAPKEASIRIRAAAAKNYARSFKRIAEEAPQQLAEALSEAYHSLDEQAGALENLADSLGVDLHMSPAEEAFGAEGQNEIGEAEEANVPMSEEVEQEAEKEAAGGGSDAWVTDRDPSGQPIKPEEVEVPRVANSGPGAAGFVTDRDKDAQPKSPDKMKIPQAEGGMAQTSIKDASDGSASAESFVKDIPQSQGQGQTPGNKAGHKRPMTQIVSPGTPTAAPAADFVKDIPQAQGAGQTPGNKAAAARKR
jgi:hypothetical protein